MYDKFTTNAIIKPVKKNYRYRMECEADLQWALSTTKPYYQFPKSICILPAKQDNGK